MELRITLFYGQLLLEPEAMTAVARRSADTIVRGVHLSSRYDKPHEIEHMRRVIETMDGSLRRHVEAIWCDSKACAFYFVTLTDGAPTDRVPAEIAKAFASVGGYNGVRVTAGRKTFDFDPSWPSMLPNSDQR